MNQELETHWPECFQWKFTPDPQPGACSHHLGTFCSHRVAFWAHLGPLWEAPLGAPASSCENGSASRGNSIASRGTRNTSRGNTMKPKICFWGAKRFVFRDLEKSWPGCFQLLNTRTTPAGKKGGVNQELETHWPERFQWKFTPDPQPGARSHHLGTFCFHCVAFWAHLGPLWEAPLGGPAPSRENGSASRGNSNASRGARNTSRGNTMKPKICLGCQRGL